MTDDRDPHEPDEDDAIGYGRPPKHSQFKRGHSGNPRGKQRGDRNLASDVKRMLASIVKFDTKQGRSIRMRTQE